jgi:hypothetical protein
VVKVGSSTKVRFKLTKKARALLRRLGRINARVAIQVSRGGSMTEKIVTARLKPPRGSG